jgi:hypothetical protein
MKWRGGKSPTVFRAFASGPQCLLLFIGAVLAGHPRDAWFFFPICIGYLGTVLNKPIHNPGYTLQLASCFFQGIQKLAVISFSDFNILPYLLVGNLHTKTAILGTENGCFGVPRKQKGAEAKNQKTTLNR